MNFVAVLIWFIPLFLGLRPQGPANTGVAEQIKQLATSRPTAERLAAAKRLRQLYADPSALRSLPALAICAKDADARLRTEALRALAEISHEHKRPCPLALVQGFFDHDEDVRATAWTYVGAFKKYPNDALPLLLRAAEHTDPYVRQSVMLPLAALGEKSPEILAALKKRTNDKDLLVRNNGSSVFRCKKSTGQTAKRQGFY
jgi:HEAT repeat protein